MTHPVPERDPSTQHARSELDRALGEGDGSVDLGRAALWIAAEAAPGLNVDGYLARLDGLAAEFAREAGGGMTASERSLALMQWLNSRHGFRGNREDYYDPRNSMLNEVLDRRRGIPITLSLVLLEVAKRIDLPLVGVGLPGHFIVRTRAEPPTLLDPFDQRCLDHMACQALLQRAAGASARLEPRHLRPTPPRLILGRMLSNLKQIYMQQQDWIAALGCSDRILQVLPQAVGELRERGWIFARLECYGAALADLETYVRRIGDPELSHSAAPTLDALRAKARRVH